jgi:hypothetical protein
MQLVPGFEFLGRLPWKDQLLAERAALGLHRIHRTTAGTIAPKKNITPRMANTTMQPPSSCCLVIGPIPLA